LSRANEQHAVARAAPPRGAAVHHQATEQAAPPDHGQATTGQKEVPVYGQQPGQKEETTPCRLTHPQADARHEGGNDAPSRRKARRWQ